MILAPLGVLLGMPFPAGLRFVSMEAPELVPLGWGINAFFTVIGTVIGLILAMTWGFKVVLLLAGCSYLISWVAVADFSRVFHHSSTG